MTYLEKLSKAERNDLDALVEAIIADGLCHIDLIEYIRSNEPAKWRALDHANHTDFCLIVWAIVDSSLSADDKRGLILSLAYDRRFAAFLAFYNVVVNTYRIGNVAHNILPVRREKETKSAIACLSMIHNIIIGVLPAELISLVSVWVSYYMLWHVSDARGVRERMMLGVAPLVEVPPQFWLHYTEHLCRLLETVDDTRIVSCIANAIEKHNITCPTAVVPRRSR